MKRKTEMLMLALVFAAFGASLVIAEKAKESPVQLVVSLTDGSRVAGGTSLASLPLQSGALGKVEIPIEKIRTIKFSADHKSATVSLGNGDKVQGGIEMVSLRLRTLVGVVTIPLDKTTEIEVRQGGGNLVEWDILPFPRDSDWPGPRGKPATVDDGEIVIQGQPVCAKQTYSAPLSFECEFTVDQPLTHGEFAAITFIPEGTDIGVYWPVGAVNVVLLYEGAGNDGGHLDITQWGRRPDLVSLTKEPFALQAGKPYHLRVEVLSDALRVTLNGQVYKAEGVTLPFKAFHIRLYGWKPDKVWHVRNVTVR